MAEVCLDMEKGSWVKYSFLGCFIICGFKCRIRRDTRQGMREKRCNLPNTRITVLVNGQVSGMGNNVPIGCRRWCRTAQSIVGRLPSIAELMGVSRMRVVMFLANLALVTLVRFRFLRLSCVEFVSVHLLVVEVVDFM